MVRGESGGEMGGAPQAAGGLLSPSAAGACVRHGVSACRWLRTVRVARGPSGLAPQNPVEVHNRIVCNMSAAAENEKKGPSKKELNKLARKEKRQGGGASEAPAEEPAAVTFVVHVPKNQAFHPLLTRAVELLTKGARDFAVKYVAHSDAALGNLSALYFGGECIVGDANIAKFLIRSTPSASHLYGPDALSASLVDQWLDFYSGSVSAGTASTGVVEQYLVTKTFLVGHSLSLADVAVFLLFRKSADASAGIKRFLRLIAARLPADVVNGAPLQVTFVSNKTVKEPVKKEAAPANASKEASKEEPEEAQEGGTCPPLPGAVDGEVVTRFPPEPSGYLHIGHAKAVLLNQYYAQRYKGKLLIRFDDTNPTKEKEEFEQNILRDLQSLGVQPHQVSVGSDRGGRRRRRGAGDDDIHLIGTTETVKCC